jgi:hypothetical protein
LDTGLCGRRQRETDLLRAGAASGDPGAVWTLAGLLVEQGRRAEAPALMRRDADAGNTDVLAWFDMVDCGER